MHPSMNLYYLQQFPIDSLRAATADARPPAVCCDRGPRYSNRNLYDHHRAWHTPRVIHDLLKVDFVKKITIKRRAPGRRGVVKVTPRIGSLVVLVSDDQDGDYIHVETTASCWAEQLYTLFALADYLEVKPQI